MALNKSITLDNGIQTEYHRILFIASTINSQISIAVVSYINKDLRELEKNNAAADIYKSVKTFEKPYSENFTISEAYEYLKTLPDYEGATDI